MPSPKVKKPYAIIRDDNTYVVYDLTKDEFKKLADCLIDGHKFVELSLGIIGLKDVRAVVEQKPEMKETKEEKSKYNESGTPDVDVMTFEYLKEQEKMVQEWLREHEKDEEVEGGRFS